MDKQMIVKNGTDNMESNSKVLWENKNIYSYILSCSPAKVLQRSIMESSWGVMFIALFLLNKKKS